MFFHSGRAGGERKNEGRAGNPLFAGDQAAGAHPAALLLGQKTLRLRITSRCTFLHPELGGEGPPPLRDRDTLVGPGGRVIGGVVPPSWGRPPQRAVMATHPSRVGGWLALSPLARHKTCSLDCSAQSALPSSLGSSSRDSLLSVKSWLMFSGRSKSQIILKQHL